MTNKDKTNLLHFITLTGMFIYPVDGNNVTSFIHGYEFATKRRCDFTQLSRQLLKDKYNINYSSDGWPGQITRLAKKLSLSWVTTFKRIVLEIVASEQNGGLDKTQTEIIKKRVLLLIGRINSLGHPWFNESWKEEWLSLCSTRSKWFKQLWADNEWAVIKLIDKQVQADDIFAEEGNHTPTEQLLKLKDRFDRATKKNGT